MQSQRIIFIVGPTAVGKSEVAFRLAPMINAEIISADSMQIYREIMIASNKPPSDYLRKIPHHLIGIVSAEESFDVAKYHKFAWEVMARIQKEGKIPLVVGGSGLYVSILIDGIFAQEVHNEEIRHALKKAAQAEGNASLYARLKQLDPQAAAKIHPHDERRTIRALEVVELTRQPISELQKKREGLWGKFAIQMIGLNRERPELYERIDHRVDAMFQEGLVEEVRQLNKMNLSQTAVKSIGIREILGLIAGDYDLERARYLVKRNTRRYAKRQLTWFRKDKRISWTMLHKNDRAQNVALRMKEMLTL